jgi:hypothetical protein
VAHPNPAVAADGAGIPAFQVEKPSQPASLLNLFVQEVADD